MHYYNINQVSKLTLFLVLKTSLFGELPELSEWFILYTTINNVSVAQFTASLHHFPLPWFTHYLLISSTPQFAQSPTLRLAFATHPLPSPHSPSSLLSALLTTCLCSPSTSCHSALPRFPSCFSSVTSPTPHWFLSIPGLFCFPPLSFSNWYFYKPHSRCQVKAPPRQVVALRTCAAQWSRPGWEKYVLSS